MIENNCPNNLFGKHKCCVLLKSWDFMCELTVDVGGNCQGLDVIKVAADQVVSMVFEKGITLLNGGDSLDVEPGEKECDIERMIVSVSILSFAPDKDRDDDGSQ